MVSLDYLDYLVEECSTPIGWLIEKEKDQTHARKEYMFELERLPITTHRATRCLTYLTTYLPPKQDRLHEEICRQVLRRDVDCRREWLCQPPAERPTAFDIARPIVVGRQ
jgi:hypothetical protein